MEHSQELIKMLLFLSPFKNLSWLFPNSSPQPVTASFFCSPLAAKLKEKKYLLCLQFLSFHFLMSTPLRRSSLAFCSNSAGRPLVKFTKNLHVAESKHREHQSSPYSVSGHSSITHSSTPSSLTQFSCTSSHQGPPNITVPVNTRQYQSTLLHLVPRF